MVLPVSRLDGVFAHGQSLWFDFIRRDLLDQGGLARLIDESAIRGLTSNPAIFKQAIAGTALYDDALQAQIDAGERDPESLYEGLAIADIQQAADAFAPLYAQSEGLDGWVSLEVSPTLAHDVEGSVAAAKRLSAAVNRPNLMIKVPGTRAGVKILPQLLAAGISVNVTLLFGRAAYRAIADAWVAGMTEWTANGGDPKAVESVASFFVSRIDAAADPKLPKPLQGTTAIANARAAYADFLALLETPAAKALLEQGVRPQRMLWASTGTKNPDYSPTMYLDALIGPHTVNTVPPATLDAFRSSGTVTRSLDTDLPAAEQQLAKIAEAGIKLDDITDQLCIDGIAQFETAYADLLAAVTDKRDRMLAK